VSNSVSRRTRLATGSLAVLGGVAVLADAVLGFAAPVGDVGLALTAAALAAGATATYRVDRPQAAVLAGCACCLLASPVVALAGGRAGAALGALVVFGGALLAAVGFWTGR